jgi:hypothetical protein
MAVLAPESSRFLDLARDVAADRDESVVHAIDRLPAGEPVVYVDAPDSVDEETLLALQRRHLSGDATDDAFGIVTGHTEAAARDLYFADHEYDGGHLVLSKNRDLSFRDADVTVLAGDDLTAHAVSERMGGGSRSLSILVPGWPIHIYFEDGLLCGFPASRSTDGLESGTQPYCVTDGEMDCPLAGDVVHAERLDASHVFVGSCASLVDNNNTGLPVHVG